MLDKKNSCIKVHVSTFGAMCSIIMGVWLTPPAQKSLKCGNSFSRIFIIPLVWNTSVIVSPSKILLKDRHQWPQDFIKKTQCLPLKKAFFTLKITPPWRLNTKIFFSYPFRSVFNSKLYSVTVHVIIISG